MHLKEIHYDYQNIQNSIPQMIQISQTDKWGFLLLRDPPPHTYVIPLPSRLRAYKANKLIELSNLFHQLMPDLRLSWSITEKHNTRLPSSFSSILTSYVHDFQNGKY
jgi:hypothetical protein